METLYRGFEMSLLAISLALGFSAYASMGQVGSKGAIEIAVVLPMLSVMADR